MQEPKDILEGIPFQIPKRKKTLLGGHHLVYLLAFLLGIVIVYNALFVYVQPGQVALKEVKIGIKRGIHSTVYGPGLLFRKPFGMDIIHLFPQTVLVFEMTNFPDISEKVRNDLYRFEKAAHIQTSDGFYVDVDCTIIYKIADPYKVITTIGPGLLYEDNGIMPKAEPVLKQSLGQLTTEEFYNSPLRYEKTLIAKEMLNDQLNSKGLIVEHILVRYFQYSDEIQKNIEEKKLKDQLVFKNQAEAKAAREEANLKRIIQEGDATVKVKLQEGHAYVTEQNAERDLYVRSRHAEADLLVKLAEAKKTELKNNALQTIGSDRMVGLKMAEVLKGLETVVLPSDGQLGFNPLDVKKSLQLFDVKERE